MGDIAYETMEDYRAIIRELEQENKRLSEKNKIYSNALIQEKEEKRLLKKEAEYWKNESKKKDKEIKSKKEVIRYYRKEKAKLVEKNLILTLDLGKEIKKNLILEGSLNAGFTKLL